SNIVAITGSSSDPQEAADIANAFGAAIVEERTEQMHDQIEKTLPSLEAQLKSSPDQAVGPESVGAVIVELQTLNAASDPTMRVETKAEAPTSPASPKPLLSVVGGIIAGLALGIGAAFAAQGLDPRLRR